MSPLRQDPLTGRWVIMAARRRGRPNEFAARLQSPCPADAEFGHAVSDCPFCQGQEDQTPSEVMTLGRDPAAAANSPGWRVRVFPNKYPAVMTEASGDETDPEAGTDLFPGARAAGGHEVVACCPNHEKSLATLPQELIREVLAVVQNRVQALARQNETVRYVLAFGNHGPEAGATLSHPHLQIIATEVVPAAVVDKVANFLDHHQRTQRCLLCDILQAEVASGQRMIMANEHWVAVAPWASRYALEMKLVPRRHWGSMADMSESELDSLADLLRRCLVRLEDLNPAVSYNLVMHGEPVANRRGSGYGNERLDGMDQPGLFHWHLEILPRLSRLAGFEAGTGFAINSLPPETAAARLRSEGS